MNIERTFDLKLVRRMALEHEVLRHIVDDDTSVDEWRPREDGLYLVAMTETDRELGIFAFLPVNAVTLEVHTLFAPGMCAREAAALAREWVWQNTRCERIMTVVPEYNRLALALARRSGMTEFGFNPNSYRRRGVLMGLHMLGVSRPCR